MIQTLQNKDYEEFLFTATTHLLKPLNELLNTGGELMKLDNGAAGDAQKKLSGEILTRGHQLLDLINDIRDYAEIQTNRLILEKKPTDLNVLMKDVLNVAAWLVKSKPQLSLQQEISASLPTLSIHDMRIQQVLINLIHNAVKFCDAGVIKISVEPGDDQINFRVSDNGSGIAADKFALVFAPFHTALNKAADGRSGLGLGLPISKYIVEAHDGRIWFESIEGQGSTFSFSLPNQTVE